MSLYAALVPNAIFFIDVELVHGSLPFDHNW